MTKTTSNNCYNFRAKKTSTSGSMPSHRRQHGCNLGRCRKWTVQQRQLNRKPSSSKTKLIFDPGWGWQRLALSDKNQPSVPPSGDSTSQLGRAFDSPIEIVSSEDEEEMNSFAPTQEDRMSSEETTDAAASLLALPFH